MTTTLERRQANVVVIPVERREAIAAAIVDLQERGEPTTNDNIRKRVGGGRKFVTTYMKQWRQQQRGVAPQVACAPETPVAHAPVPRSAPVAQLEALRQRCAEDDEVWARLERETQQHQRDRAQHWSAYRQAMTEAQRLLPLFRRTHQASRLALYAGHAEVQAEAQRLRHALIALVGEAEVEQLATDPAYSPEWLTAR